MQHRVSGGMRCLLSAVPPWGICHGDLIVLSPRLLSTAQAQANCNAGYFDTTPSGYPYPGVGWGSSPPYNLSTGDCGTIYGLTWCVHHRVAPANCSDRQRACAAAAASTVCALRHMQSEKCPAKCV